MGELLGINAAAATTAIKPAGNSSVLLRTGNTVTGWYSRYIKRHVRVNAIDPMAQFLIDAGVPHWPDVNEPNPRNPRVWVFAFPLESPEGALLKDDLTAIQQLENWLMFKRNYAEHGVSVTIYIEENEWVEVGNWILKNWDHVSGLTFLPKNNNTYALAPYESLTKEQYDQFVAGFPVIPWEKFHRYESGHDSTAVHRELACTAGGCEI